MFKPISILIVALAVHYVRGTCETPPLEQGVPLVDQQTVVNNHNEVRSLILQGAVAGQPKGKNITTLKWDAALAAAGQQISNTCVFGHVGVSDDRWWWVGQNLYAWSSTGVSLGSNWESAVLAWFSEYKTYNYSTTIYNHYTQVVWGSTEYVGCGYTAYMSGGWLNKLYVCNYGPGGNIAGLGPYELA